MLPFKRYLGEFKMRGGGKEHEGKKKFCAERKRVAANRK